MKLPGLSSLRPVTLGREKTSEGRGQREVADGYASCEYCVDCTRYECCVAPTDPAPPIRLSGRLALPEAVAGKQGHARSKVTQATSTNEEQARGQMPDHTR